MAVKHATIANTERYLHKDCELCMSRLIALTQLPVGWPACFRAGRPDVNPDSLIYGWCRGFKPIKAEMHAHPPGRQ